MHSLIADLEVSDVNLGTNSVTLEGETDAAKFILLIDYDLAGDPTDHSVGDTYQLDLGMIKKKRKRVAKAKKTTKSTHCLGSGSPVLKKQLIPREHQFANDKAICPHCSKARMVRYDGTFRKHKP